MCKTIMLVRHGKAKKIQEGQADTDRPLTRAGRYSLQATVPKAFKSLRKKMSAEGASVAIWTSPAMRSCQTADIIRLSLGLDGFERRDSLAASDLTTPLEEALTDHHDIIILIGHAPAINKAAAMLCGVPLPFEAGAIASFSISQQPPTCQTPPKPKMLRWFIQGPDVSCWEVVCSAEDLIKAQANLVQACFRGFFETPTSSRALHELRVSMRKLRSYIAFLSPYLKKKPAHAVQRSLHDLFLLTTQLRELDVFAECVHTLTPEARELPAVCSDRRDAECEHVIAAFTAYAARHNEKKLYRALHHLPWKGSVLKEGISQEALKLRYQGMYASYKNKLASLDYEIFAEVHHTRKRAKSLRYLSGVLPSGMSENTKNIEQLTCATQDLLGDLCDDRSNLGMADKLFQEDLSAQAKEELGHLHEVLEANSHKLLNQLKTQDEQ
ncbi:MAG: CHAD domain-containing protein [Atopobiaceae bacterium]|jgi:phosphohistidine phosphatase SixA/CHAD domain-containing protein